MIEGKELLFCNDQNSYVLRNQKQLFPLFSEETICDLIIIVHWGYR